MKKDNLHNLLIIGLILTLSLSGCGRLTLDEDTTAQEQWEMAKFYFEREKYLDTIDLLTLFTMNYSGSTLIDSAQYLLGESHFVLHEYILAESEYGRLVRNFPQSPLVDDAWLKIILCNFYMSPRFDLDQIYTHRTVNTIGDFLDMYSGADLSVHLAARKSGWQTLRSVFTFGIWRSKNVPIEELPLERTKVVFQHRRLGFGRWLLRVFTFGLYHPATPSLNMPHSSEVAGDWIVNRALFESKSRLAKKDFKAGDLYYRMKKYPSAIIYFDSVLESFPDTPWAETALRLKANSYFAMHKYREAALSYERYLNEYNGDERRSIENRLEECRHQMQNVSAAQPEAKPSSTP